MNATRLEPKTGARPAHLSHAPGPARTALHLSGGPASLLAREPESAWEARGLADLVPPATLSEARERRDELARLLGRERAAAADFLLALADFDRRRGWERLGHASLFAFLNRELGLSNGAAWSRSSAARLLPRFPAVEVALRSGRLCLSAVGELARVLTPENEAEVLPRFFGCSFREAREIAAAIRPNPDPPRRDALTVVRAAAKTAVEDTPARAMTAATAAVVSPAFAAAGLLRAHEVGMTRPARAREDAAVPLTADLRRLGVTVSARFVEKLARARAGLSHKLPGATTEQVLEAALDLLLEQQARRKALVKRPRKARAAPASTPTTSPTPTEAPGLASASASTLVQPPAAPRRRPRVPADLERAVRIRDGDRCQYPLDAGGVCGSTWQVELDHLVPLALGGPTTASNLRCACSVHNRYAARVELGPAVMATTRRRGRRR